MEASSVMVGNHLLKQTRIRQSTLPNQYSTSSPMPRMHQLSTFNRMPLAASTMILKVVLVWCKTFRHIHKICRFSLRIRFQPAETPSAKWANSAKYRTLSKLTWWGSRTRLVIMLPCTRAGSQWILDRKASWIRKDRMFSTISRS